MIEESAHSVTARFEVRDTGVGIAPEGRAKLFQPFSQVREAARASAEPASAWRWPRLVEAMDGTIGVESKPGKGSTFWCTARFERRAPRRSGARSRASTWTAAGCSSRSPTRRTAATSARWSRPSTSSARSRPTATRALLLLRDAARAGRPFDVAVLDAALEDMVDGALLHAISDDPRIAPTRSSPSRTRGSASTARAATARRRGRR